MSSLAYFFKESLRGFTRNLSTALGSIVTIFLSLLIIGVFLVGGITVDNVMKSVESEVSITAYVADDASEADIQTVEDFLVSSNIMPLGSLVFVLFCVSRRGWGWKRFLAEANEGEGLKFPRWLRPWMRFGVPVLVVIILVMGWVPIVGSWL